MKLNNFLTVILGCLFIFSSCEKSTPENGNNDENNPSENPGGYASSGGVMILNQGIRSECSSITYISPDGDVEENVYSKVNGTEFGHSAQDMYMHNGKFYILSDNCDEFNTLGYYLTLLLIADQHHFPQSSIISRLAISKSHRS